MSKWILVDVEADGPCPGTDMFSMVSFGAVVLDKDLKNTFYGQTAPISKNWIHDALKVSGHTRAEHEAFDRPDEVMQRFDRWLAKFKDRVIFVSDNPAFDWQFINYYFHAYVQRNPFGFSARRIGDLYSGLVGDVKESNSWKRFKKTKHTHHPVDDAMGNAEALIEIAKRHNINIPI